MALVRNFIHDSLYNPTFGYFSKQINILSLKNIEYSKIPSNATFLNTISQEYSNQTTDSKTQLWHTPTELFNPFFGYSIANYITKTHSLHDNLVIYEMGPGNGTLMNNILDFLKLNHPKIYSNVEYNIIEISPKLSSQISNKNSPHSNHINIFNTSITNWSTTELRNCYFIGMEVLDNLSHDIIRYDTISGIPVQAIVLEENNSFEEVYQPVSDPLIQKYLDIQSKSGINPSYLHNSIFSKIQRNLPFAPNLSPKEFIPTTCLAFLEILQAHFPNHKLILSDFHELPEAIEGINAPVVQTMYNGKMLPCTTYLVKKGWFDIFFPTNFSHLQKIYRHLFKKEAQISSFGEFNSLHGDAIATRLKSGENPMQNFYKNVSFLTS